MGFKEKVEEIGKKVGDTATNAYNTVADKSGKLIEETKMKVSISDKKQTLKKSMKKWVRLFMIHSKLVKM